MMRILLIFIIIFGITKPVSASLDIGVSEPNLEITTGFIGDTLTIFGTAQGGGDVIIIVKGPETKTTIHRKLNLLGLWLTGETVSFNDVPGYYNVASSRPVPAIASLEQRQSMRLGINSLIFNTTDEVDADKKYRFQEALIQNKQLAGLYSLTPNAVDFMNDTLFKTRIYMPSNVPVGQYDIKAFQFQNGQLVDSQTRPFQIAQSGLAGDVHDLAYDMPITYGISVILIALFSSFMAITLLRRE